MTLDQCVWQIDLYTTLSSACNIL